MIGFSAHGVGILQPARIKQPVLCNKQNQQLTHKDTFARQEKEPHFAGPSGKYSFLGDLEAEKEARAAKEKWDDARHNSKLSETEKKN